MADGAGTEAAHPFGWLASANSLNPHLEAILASGNWQERQEHLAAAYRSVPQMQNDLGIIKPISKEPRGFHDRPFLVIEAGNVAGEIWQLISDPEIRSLPRGVGKMDQILDSTDILSYAGRCRSFAALSGAKSSPRQSAPSSQGG